MKILNDAVRVTLVVICFALLPKAEAVTPAPDGGYPNFNTAEGQNALFSLTTGKWNTALGALALFSDTTGNGNTATGDQCSAQQRHRRLQYGCWTERTS